MRKRKGKDGVEWKREGGHDSGGEGRSREGRGAEGRREHESGDGVRVRRGRRWEREGS